MGVYERVMGVVRELFRGWEGYRGREGCRGLVYIAGLIWVRWVVGGLRYFVRN